MPEAPPRQWPLVVAVGATQTLAWASSYYLVAILAAGMARDLATTPTNIYAAFSTSLLIAALVGPRVGRTIDAFGGREVLACSNLIFAAGLALLGTAGNLVTLWAGWAMMGLGMGLGLYDAAFATIGRLLGDRSRSAITGITLLAGFASTVGWPLSTLGEATIGWRATCFAWAAVHVLFALPVNMLCIPRIIGTTASRNGSPAKANLRMDSAMWILAVAFAAGWIVSTGIAAHLPRLLVLSGASATEAVAAAALVGPAQVLARVVEITLMRNAHPLWSGRAATLAHPIGAAMLLTGGGWFAAPFAILHGAGNGIFTIVRGTVPLAVFGSKDYGYRLGLLGAPARIGQSAAPLLFGWFIEETGTGVLLLSSFLYLSACLAFAIIPARQPAA